MIIFINGSINSGKSTVAKVLVEKIPKSAHIEIDTLRHFISWMPLEESIPINLENTVSIIKNFSKYGLNSIVTYPLSQKNHDLLIDSLSDLGEKIFVFTLNPDLAVIGKDRGDRKLDEWEKNRIKYHYEIGINNPSFGIILDTTNQTPEETAQKIIDKINEI